MQYMQSAKISFTPTLNQLKLSIAMELKSEGYSTIVFDKLIETCGRIVRAHVYCEDELGLRMAVYCINKPSQVRPNEILDVIELIKSSVEDCDVALAFPLTLLRKAEVLIGLTGKVYMLDSDGRVWIHYHWNGMHDKAMGAPLNFVNSRAEEDSEALNGRVEITQMRLPYVV